MEINISPTIIIKNFLVSYLKSPNGFQTNIIKLPQETDINELKQLLEKQLSKIPRWKVMICPANTQSNVASVDCEILTELNYYIEPTLWQKINRADNDQNGRDVVLRIVFVREKIDKYIVIHSTMLFPLPIVVGNILEDVNNKVIENAQLYFWGMHLDFSKSLLSMEVDKDFVSRHDIKLNPILAVILLIVLTPVALYIGFLIELMFRSIGR